MIVMKFGGTSVGTAEAIRRTAGIVRDRVDRRPVVVVSALSGVTNALIQAARDAQKRKVGPEKSAAQLTERHRQVIGELDLPSDLVDAELKRLEEVLRGIFFLRELTARSLDYVMSFGEAMSSRVVAAHLAASGVPARAWMGWEAGIVTDDAHGEAAVLPETWSRVKQKLGQRANDDVPVVTGFLGRTKGGERSTLGRGGSDYSAAIIGRAIGADEIQIWTDVSGILSADPRVVADAFTLRYVTFAEAAELAYFGAKVLHPKTIEPAVQAKIPVRILNTFAPDDPGTLVVAESTEENERVVEGLAALKAQGQHLSHVTVVPLTVHGPPLLQSEQAQAGVTGPSPHGLSPHSTDDGISRYCTQSWSPSQTTPSQSCMEQAVASTVHTPDAHAACTSPSAVQRSQTQLVPSSVQDVASTGGPMGHDETDASTPPSPSPPPPSSEPPSPPPPSTRGAPHVPPAQPYGAQHGGESMRSQTSPRERHTPPSARRPSLPQAATGTTHTTNAAAPYEHASRMRPSSRRSRSLSRAPRLRRPHHRPPGPRVVRPRPHPHAASRRRGSAARGGAC